MKPEQKNGIRFFQVPFPETPAGLSHGFFTRCGGVSPGPYASLNVGPLSADDPANRAENLRRISSVLKAPPQALVAARQVHGNRVIRVTSVNASRSVFFGADPLEGDALITDRPGLWLGILTADCLPVLLFDPVKGVVGAAHAGWRGTHARIASRTLREMARLFACRPGDVLAALGPAIGPCCYEVGNEVARLFAASASGHGQPSVRTSANGRQTLDLPGMNRGELLAGGVPAEQIFHVPVCTRCRADLFFSVRAQGEPTGRQLALIGLHGANRVGSVLSPTQGPG